MVPSARSLCYLFAELALVSAVISTNETISWTSEMPITLAEMFDSDSTSSPTDYEETVSEPSTDVAIEPKQAGCEPELRTIDLRQTDDLSIYYFPSCTRIKKCGGCCGNNFEARTCQPVETEQLRFKITEKKYVGKLKWKVVAHKVITVEQDIRCECGCIVKPTDCNPLQTFYRSECLCKCTNMDDKRKCDADRTIKKWDPTSCTCKCKNNPICSSGYILNDNTCSCEEDRVPLRGLL